MLLIVVLRERRPETVYLDYARGQDVQLPPDSRVLPENPVCCRNAGFKTITYVLDQNSKTLDLLETARQATDTFVAGYRHWERHDDLSISASGWCRKVLATSPAADTVSLLPFRERHEKQVYETIGWKSFVCCHALQHCVPLSEAAVSRTLGRLLGIQTLLACGSCSTVFTGML